MRVIRKTSVLAISLFGVSGCAQADSIAGLSPCEEALRQARESNKKRALADERETARRLDERFRESTPERKRQ